MNFIGKFVIVSACILMAETGAFAQETAKMMDKEAARAAGMNKLDFLIGEWQGKGWIMIGRERKEFTARESLTPKLDGKIVVVEGLGKNIDEETGIEKVIHNAYGVFSFDDASGGMRFIWFKADGQKGDTAIEFGDKTFTWAFDVPENKVSVRFTEKLTDKGNWLEIGEVTRDGGAMWLKFFEMELSRVK